LNKQALFFLREAAMGVSGLAGVYFARAIVAFDGRRFPALVKINRNS
jgi:hypothetical protein